MSKDFNGAAGAPHPAPPQPIATKAELDARMAARPTPKLEPQLAPRGWEAAHVQKIVNETSERRIAALRERLQTARNKTMHDHTISRLRGKPRADFDQSRS